MFERYKLPQEIEDKIFLYLDYKTLSKARDLQSGYVKRITQFYNIYEAAKVGNLVNIKWVLNGEFIYTGNALLMAVYSGNLNNMKWIYENTKCGYYTYDIFGEAVRNGNLDNMKWLLEVGFKLNSSLLEQAVNKGILDNIKWIRGKDIEWVSSTFSVAASHGNLENMKWMLENGCPLSEYVLTSAIKNGKQTNIRWLLEHGCQGTVLDLISLVRIGNLEIIKLFCLYHPDIIQYGGYQISDAAIIKGNLKVMKWLYEHDCKFDTSKIDFIKHVNYIKNAKLTKNEMWLLKIDKNYNKTCLTLMSELPQIS